MNFLLLAVLLTIMQTLPLVPREAANSAAGAGQNIQRDARNNETPAASPPPIVNPVAPKPEQNPSNSPSPKDAEQPIRVRELPTVTVGKNWADWVLWGFNGLLVIAGFLGIRVAYKTLKTIERQARSTHHQAVQVRKQTLLLSKSAEATQKAAEAALLTAQAAINTERPWLEVVSNFQPHHPLRFFECFNRGNTPARLVIATADHRFVAQIDDLPAIPEYSNPIIWPDSHLLVPDESIQLCPNGVKPDEIIRHADMQALIEQSRQFLVYYGHIIYRDTLYPESSSGKGIHSTRWCYVWLPKERLFTKSGPRGYNEYT